MSPSSVKGTMFRFFLLALVCSLDALGQTIETSGKVVDDGTGYPLPFVNIVVKRTRQGVTTDIEGRFRLISSPGDTVEFRYVGFETRRMAFNQSTADVIVRLRESNTELGEVVIKPGSNPALRIIRRVMANKRLNDPDQIDGYTCHSYNKLVCSLALAGKASAFGKDSSKVKTFIEHSNAFVSESYTLRKYRKPDQLKEVVLANRFSGIKDPFFAFLATDLQPFGFYKDFVTLMGSPYLNPIGEGALNRYDYTLMDTVLQGLDSLFVIAFQPLPGKVFESLEGQLYISSDGYALQHVLAQPSDHHQLMEARIQQQYRKIDGRWFPVMLNSEIIFHEYQVRNIRPYYYSRSYVSDISFSVNLTGKDFDLLQVSFDPLANRRPDSTWRRIRVDSISQKELNTYHFYDSVKSKTRSLNTLMKFAEGAIVGRFKAGPFYLPSEYLVRFNQYEGFRPGIGLQTAETVSRLFSLEGYVGYGFRDKALKYGGGLIVHLNPRTNGQLSIRWLQDVFESANTDFIRGQNLSGSQTFRRFLTARMDSVTRMSVVYEWKPSRPLSLKVFAQREERNPAYQYNYLPSGDPTQKAANFTTAMIGGQLRLAFHEPYTQIGQFSIPTQLPNPLLLISISKAFDGWLGGAYDFSRIEIQWDHFIRWAGGGKTSYEVALGTADGNIPYPYMFNGRGTLHPHTVSQGILIQNYFQTMDLYEFASDQYAYLFLQHNLGRLTGNRSKYFRPELSLIQNSGWGNLRQPQDHIGIPINTMEKGFFESGLVLNNLIRFKYVNLLYFGVGAGFFYRYGAYAHPNNSDNGLWKFFVTMTL